MITWKNGYTATEDSYYAMLILLNNEDLFQYEIEVVGARAGAWFQHKNEFHVMHYEKAMKCSDAKMQGQQVKSE